MPAVVMLFSISPQTPVRHQLAFSGCRYFVPVVYSAVMTRLKPAVLRAESGLHAIIRDARANGATLLPSLNILAARLQVSRVTVLKAMRRMQQTGLVVGLPGRGYMITGDPSLASSVQAPLPCLQPPSAYPRWRQLRDALSRDILEGRFPPGNVLPTTKELRVRYGCGYSSLLHGIRSLLTEGRLTQHGRGYAVQEVATPKPSAVLGLVSYTHYPARLATIRPHGGSLWRTMEYECTRRRLSMVGRDVGAVVAKPWPERGTMVGCVMAHLGMGREGPAQALCTILSSHLPVALPRDMSLVSFDDTTEAYLQGVTSYNFNIPALVNAVLEHIVSPGWVRRHGQIVEIPGTVLERRTSGPVGAAN